LRAEDAAAVHRILIDAFEMAGLSSLLPFEESKREIDAHAR